MANTNVYTATYLLDSAKRRGQIPEASDRSFSTDDLLALMSEELQTYMVALLMSVREEWFVQANDQATVQSQAEYRIPVRSVGGKLRQVLLGNDPNWAVIQRVEPKQQYGSVYGFNSYTSSNLMGYILKDTNIQLLPPVTAGQTLRMMYFRRPNRIVNEDKCGAITAINTGTHAVTIDPATVPTAFSSSSTYDLVRGTPGFETLAMDQTATLATNVLTFSSALPSGLAVGDFVCLAGEAPVAQLPVEMQPLLTQRVVVKVLEALGDPKVSTAKSMMDEQQRAALTLLTPRAEGDSRYILNYNGPGFNGRLRRRW